MFLFWLVICYDLFHLMGGGWKTSKTRYVIYECSLELHIFQMNFTEPQFDFRISQLHFIILNWKFENLNCISEISNWILAQPKPLGLEKWILECMVIFLWKLSRYVSGVWFFKGDKLFGPRRCLSGPPPRRACWRPARKARLYRIKRLYL